MPRNPYANSIIANYEIKVWRSSEAGSERKKLRTVQRIFANGTKNRCFEKRKFYKRDGESYVGTAMALNESDIDFIIENAVAIKESLQMNMDTLGQMTQSEEILPNGQVRLDGVIYDVDKFYPKK